MMDMDMDDTSGDNNRYVVNYLEKLAVCERENWYKALDLAFEGHAGEVPRSGAGKDEDLRKVRQVILGYNGVGVGVSE